MTNVGKDFFMPHRIIRSAGRVLAPTVALLALSGGLSAADSVTVNADGTVVIGTDPGGTDLLRVGGATKVSGNVTSTGAVSAASASVTGAVSAGTVVANSVTVNGNLSSTGTVSAASATLSGGLTATGAVAAGSATVNGNAVWHAGVAALPPGGTTSFLRSDGTWVSIVAGLSYFGESRNVTGPNSGVPAHALVPTGAEANIDAVISPKGTGALLASTPDGTITGGNKRGTYAVDLQLYRNAATNVAGGNYSGMLGGMYGSIGSNGIASVVLGGLQNSVQLNQSGALAGTNNLVNGMNCVSIGGDSNTVGSRNSVVLGGYQNAATSRSSVVMGEYGSSLGNRFDVTRGTDTSLYAGTPAAGRAQSSQFFMLVKTTTSTATPMEFDCREGTPGVYVGIPTSDDATYNIVAQVSAYQEGATNNAAAYVVEACAKRATGVATLALVGTPVVRSLENVSSWNVTVTADTSAGKIKINAVGAASVTIRWLADVRVVQLKRN